MSANDAALVWFRRDLRLADNPALAAAERHATVIPVFIDDWHAQAPWTPGGAQRVWLHFSLIALDQRLRELGARLIIRRGAAQPTLFELIDQTRAVAVYWNRLYEPQAIERDRCIKRALRQGGVRAQSFNGALLLEPWEIATSEHKPYRVFTPFWRNLKRHDVARPARGPSELPPLPAHIDSESVDTLGLLPSVAWHDGIRESWEPGECGAHRQLQRFLDHGLAVYTRDRDRPDRQGTSRLSPYLHFGELSPRQVWHRVEQVGTGTGSSLDNGSASYLRQLGWREFGHHVLYHFPDTPQQPLDQRFEDFPWAKSYAEDLHRWHTGRTGVPLVDAGMRELWHTGWMHNRVRMVVASWLTKNLLIPWREGARWFWDTLVDADLANNTLGWQWAAGCGADAAPYFRVFNPIRQGERFDPDGAYVRRWIPELSGLPSKHIHAPGQAPANVLQSAHLRLGEDYPATPQIDIQASRLRALDAYQQIKSGRSPSR